MSKNTINIILTILIGLIVVFGYLNLNIKERYQTKREEFISFEKSAKEIYLIKRLKKGMTAILSSLNNIKRPAIKETTVSKIYTFKNLNINDLNRLIKRVQGAYIPIKKLEIKRDTTNHATLILEVAK